MLQNETYLGNMVQGRTREDQLQVQEMSAARSPENWVVVEDTHEPLVDGETFRKVQHAAQQPQAHPEPNLRLSAEGTDLLP